MYPPACTGAPHAQKSRAKAQRHDAGDTAHTAPPHADTRSHSRAHDAVEASEATRQLSQGLPTAALRGGHGVPVRQTRKQATWPRPFGCAYSCYSCDRYAFPSDEIHLWAYIPGMACMGGGACLTVPCAVTPRNWPSPASPASPASLAGALSSMPPLPRHWRQLSLLGCCALTLPPFCLRPRVTPGLRASRACREGRHA